MEGTSPEYRQKCVALADRVEDCLRDQPVNLAMHALALVMAALALRWEEDSHKVLADTYERVTNLLHTARNNSESVCPQGQEWIKRRMLPSAPRGIRRASESTK
jgi:hypothetical protein